MADRAQGRPGRGRRLLLVRGGSEVPRRRRQGRGRALRRQVQVRRALLGGGRRQCLLRPRQVLRGPPERPCFHRRVREHPLHVQLPAERLLQERHHLHGLDQSQDQIRGEERWTTRKNLLTWTRCLRERATSLQRSASLKQRAPKMAKTTQHRKRTLHLHLHRPYRLIQCPSLRCRDVLRLRQHPYTRSAQYEAQHSLRGRSKSWKPKCGCWRGKD